MTTNKRRTVSALCVAGLLALVGCSSSDDSATDTESSVPEASAGPKPTGEPVKIGLINQEEETVAFPEGSAAAKAAVEYLNAEAGGIDGRPAELALCTTGDTAESAVACANKFANDDSVPLVIDMTYNTAAVNEILVGRKALLTWNLDIPDMTTPDLFAVDPGVLIPSQVIASIMTQQDVKSVAVLYSDSVKDFLVPPMEKAMEAAGLTIDQEVPVASGGDYTGAVTAADLDGVDGAIMVLVDPAQCSGVGKAMGDLGIDVPVVAVDVCSATSVVETGDVDGWKFAVTNTGSVDPSVADEATLEFRRVLETYSEGEPNYGTVAGPGYAFVLAAADIYEKTGVDDLTPKNINALLNSGWEYSPPTYVPLKCPGPDPFVGLCVDSMWELEAKDGILTFGSDEPVQANLDDLEALTQ